MRKAVKHSGDLRRKSSGAIFKKSVFRGNQNIPVPNTCSSQIWLTNITIEKRVGMYYKHQLENYNL